MAVPEPGRPERKLAAILAARMGRRDFVAVLGGAAAQVAWPISAHAQQSKQIPRIGVLWHAGNEDEEALYLGAVRQGFTDIGYVEGKNYVLENRFAAEQYERFDALAAELIKANVDMLVAVTLQAARAAQRATTEIPVVFVVVSDPVGFKLVDSLARPGGNITGLANVSFDLSGKRLELFKEVSGLSQVALLANAHFPMTQRLLEDHSTAARSLGLTVQEVQASTPDDIEPAIRGVKNQGAGLVVLPDSMLFNERKRIAELALKYGMPSVAFNAEMADAGILLSYGASFLVQFRRVAVYVHKILKGAKPADLPIEQPVQLELIINSKTAKALGLNIAPSLFARADRVIE